MDPQRDGYHKAVYFHEHGLVPVLPSREQFHAGCTYFRLTKVVRDRARPFGRRLVRALSLARTPPQAATPTRVVAGSTLLRFGTGAGVARTDSEPAPKEPVRRQTTDRSRVGRAIERLNEIDLLRALAMHLLSPASTLAGWGFRLPAAQVANHLLFSPHPCEQAVWDIQLIQAEPGGLELFSRRIEEAHTAASVRGRLLRTLGTVRLAGAHRFELVRVEDPHTGEVRYVDALHAPGERVVLDPEDWDRWYDHLQETIVRARRFEYLERPLDDDARRYAAPTVPLFLNLCSDLTRADYAFFRDRPIDRAWPEIGWPRRPLTELPRYAR